MVEIERLTPAHADELHSGFGRSRSLLAPWMDPPATLEAVRASLELSAATTLRYGVREPNGDLAGVVNVSGIVRGAFQSAYLGYHALYPHQGRGWMREGLKRVISAAFSEHQLHRVEANVQPANTRSARLAQGLGFRLEGHSPRYLKIGGAWRDHDRYALTVEDWTVGDALTPPP
jgi:ribosomal-protein-alanine N-acetyltransferase